MFLFFWILKRYTIKSFCNPYKRFREELKVCILSLIFSLKEWIQKFQHSKYKSLKVWTFFVEIKNYVQPRISRISAINKKRIFIKWADIVIIGKCCTISLFRGCVIIDYHPKSPVPQPTILSKIFSHKNFKRMFGFIFARMFLKLLWAQDIICMRLLITMQLGK